MCQARTQGLWLSNLLFLFVKGHNMKKLILSGILSIIFNVNCLAVESVTQTQILSSYKQELKMRQTHKFNNNQIRSFVYYWYGLHDVHAAINKSYQLLCKNNLLMIFPEITVHNKADYKKWYDGVGENIKSNIHMIKQLKITPRPGHQYRVNVLVNWQAIDKNNKFINMYATQQWLLVDGDSDTHPCIQEYKVLDFKPAL
jgi:hypothetical protein